MSTKGGLKTWFVLGLSLLVFVFVYMCWKYQLLSKIYFSKTFDKILHWKFRKFLPYSLGDYTVYEDCRNFTRCIKEQTDITSLGRSFIFCQLSKLPSTKLLKVFQVVSSEVNKGLVMLLRVNCCLDLAAVLKVWIMWVSYDWVAVAFTGPPPSNDPPPSPPQGTKSLTAMITPAC